MVVLHLAGDRYGLDLGIVYTVFHLLRCRFIILRAVHGEVLELRLTLHRLLRDVVQFSDIIEAHTRELLQTVIEFRVQFVVLAPVDPNRVPDVHAVDDRVEVLPIFVTLSEQPVDDEGPIEPEVVEEHPLALPELHLLQESEHVLSVKFHLQVAPDQTPQPHPDIAILLQVRFGSRLEVSRPHILLLQSYHRLT